MQGNGWSGALYDETPKPPFEGRFGVFLHDGAHDGFIMPKP